MGAQNESTEKRRDGERGMSLFCDTHFAPEYSRESGYSHSIKKERFEMSKTPIWLSNPN